MACGSEVEFTKTMGEEEIYAYSGAISEGMINLSLSEIETILSEMSLDLKLRKKTFHILVECLQNQYHHSDICKKSKEGEKYGIIQLYRQNNLLILKAANYVKVTKKEFLQNRIEKINALNPEELKDLYKFILNHQRMSEKGGGGLGLLDIARKSGNPLKYEFIDVDENTSLFKIEIYIS
jgi:hypothetical protein